MGFYLYRIDDEMQLRSDQTYWWDVKVQPGRHAFHLHGIFRGWGWPGTPDMSRPQDSRLELTVDLKAGHLYRVTGEPRGTTVFAWLEDLATGERVSEVASSPYYPFGSGTPIFILPIRK